MRQTGAILSSIYFNRTSYAVSSALRRPFGADTILEQSDHILARISARRELRSGYLMSCTRSLDMRKKPIDLVWRCFGLALVFLPIAKAATVSADDKEKAKPEVVAASDAKKHVGKRCTVEMTVRSSKNAAPRREYYLDSEEDFHDENNFAVVISYDHDEAFQQAGITDPAEHYKGKKLRVTGEVIHENEQVRMRVDDPKQIEVVEDKR
jgi:hypothetical protein